MITKLIVAGPRGKMGSEAIHMIMDEPSFELVACLDRKNDGKRLGDILPSFNQSTVPIYTDIQKCLEFADADVLVDLTEAESGYKHAKHAIEHHVRPVVGTSGLTENQLKELEQMGNEAGLGTIIAPNFAIGAVLMMQFAKMAAKQFPDVEIIEKHHDQKKDAPSGSAVKTADLISSARSDKEQGHPDEKELIEGARGANINGMHIHSVRLPGLVAHQEVIFGGAGQTLTIKHDSYNRDSFMNGLKFAIEKVMTMDKYIYGLEHILDS
ncbi:MAG TPA: 4-hydroxy-tetrahydrodipicolinate reductase [Virgibacillus sp.]|nr:4-hydroxy-tetrahydrodipicolinate reductase [Virgibacillus sp.]